jgi:hypothetical protein
MQEHSEALDQLMKGMAEEIKGRIPSVTGKTAAAVEVETKVTQVGLYENVKSELRVPISLLVQETGRGPTKTKTAGSPTLQEIILQWIQSRGIVPNEAKMTQEQLSFAMATKIHNEGNKFFRDSPTGYKKSGIISDSVNEQRLDTTFDVFMDKVRDQLKVKLISALKR